MRRGGLWLSGLVLVVGCANLVGIDGPGDDDDGSKDDAGAPSSGSSGASSTNGSGSSGTASSSSSSGSASGGSSSSSSGTPGDGGVPEGDLAYAAWPLPRATPQADDYAATADVVYDQVTHLTWQREVPADSMLLAAASDYCDVLSLGGFDDWRLPSRMELVSLLDVGGSGSPRIQPTAFPDTPAAWFWSMSGSTLPTAGHQSWTVHFGTGHVIWQFDDLEELRVRCVRGMTQVNPVPPHWDVGANTARDVVTGLTWTRAKTQGTDTLSNAALACQNVEMDDLTGFRLPNLRELLSFIDERAPNGNGGVDVDVFVPGGVRSAWSTTPVVGSTQVMMVDVSFGGSTNQEEPTSPDTVGVRCVKSP